MQKLWERDITSTRRPKEKGMLVLGAPVLEKNECKSPRMGKSVQRSRVRVKPMCWRRKRRGKAWDEVRPEDGR
jgi:hypothetical protein